MVAAAFSFPLIALEFPFVALLKWKLLFRYPGIDMVNELLMRLTEPINVALIGGTSASNRGAVNWVESVGHHVVFELDGYSSFNQDQKDQISIINRI